MEEFEICRCDNRATWVYMPGHGEGVSSLYCDECVPRGCECREYSTIKEHYHPPGGIFPKGEEGVDWKWTNEEKTYWCELDEKGRQYPCCEFEFFEEGIEKNLSYVKFD